MLTFYISIWDKKTAYNLDCKWAFYVDNYSILSLKEFYSNVRNPMKHLTIG